MYCKKAEDFSEVDIMGIAIRLDHSAENHLAIAVHDGESCHVIHLADHYRLLSGKLTDQYKWVEISSMDEINKMHLAAFCQTIYELNKGDGIPFAPCGGGKFDENGAYIGEVGTGMTCSLFVKELFEQQGYTFINSENWPIRECDTLWQEDVLRDFYAISEEDRLLVDHQESLIGKTLRYRPEEVAASVTFDSIPNNFDDIIPISLEINKELSF
jgi:hypothetical protein